MDVIDNLPEQQPESAVAPRRLTSILIADICAFSRMAEKDEASAIQLADLLFKLFSDITERKGGRVFKRIADGFLAEFPSAQSAMGAALEFLAEVKARNNLAPNAIEAEVRAAVHVGDVTDRDDGDIMGHGINVTSRLQALAEPGTILASSNIMNLLGRDFPHKGIKRGNLALKNISEPITAYQIDPDARRFSNSIFIGKKWSKYGAYILFALVILYFGYGQYHSNFSVIDKILKKNNLIASQLDDGGASAKISKNAISAAYIRSVLENLENSNQTSSQAAFALLEEGDLDGAVTYLEQQTNYYKDDLRNPEHLQLLHQIAAFSYYNNPQKALAYFESILELDKDDKTALIWKFRAENLLGYPEKAQATYQLIIQRDDLGDYDRLLYTMDYAFSFSGIYEFERAIEILRDIESDVNEFGDARLKAHWETELALAYVYNGDNEQGDALAQSAILTLNKIGEDTNLSRAHSMAGKVALRKAIQFPDQRDKYYDLAYEHYRKEYEVAQRINKITDRVEGIYSMAGIDLKRGDTEKAHAGYLEALRLSRQAKHFLLEIYSLMGLAELNHSAGETGIACNYVSDVKSLFAKQRVDGAEMKAPLAKRVAAIGCD